MRLRRACPTCDCAYTEPETILKDHLPLLRQNTDRCNDNAYSMGVVLHFKELKLSDAYTDTVMSESLFLL